MRIVLVLFVLACVKADQMHTRELFEGWQQYEYIDYTRNFILTWDLDVCALCAEDVILNSTQQFSRIERGMERLSRHGVPKIATNRLEELLQTLVADRHLKVIECSSHSNDNTDGLPDFIGRPNLLIGRAAGGKPVWNDWRTWWDFRNDVFNANLTAIEGVDADDDIVAWPREFAISLGQQHWIWLRFAAWKCTKYNNGWAMASSNNCHCDMNEQNCEVIDADCPRNERHCLLAF